MAAMPGNYKEFEFDRRGETFGPPITFELRIVPERRVCTSFGNPNAGHVESINMTMPAGVSVADALTAAANLYKSHGERRQIGLNEYDFSFLMRKKVFSQWTLIDGKPYFLSRDIDPKAIEEIKLGERSRTRGDLTTVLAPSDRMVTIYLV